MFAKLLLQSLLWVSPMWLSPSIVASQPTIPLGTNPLNVDEFKVVAYLKENPSLTTKSNFVFVDSNDDYKLAHLLGKYVVDVRYRIKPAVSETDSLEEVQDKVDALNSIVPLDSDEVILSILGNMTETVKVSD